MKITVKTEIMQTKKQHLGIKYPFGRNNDGDSNTAENAYQISMKEGFENPRGRAKRMRLPMKNIWANPQDGLK